MSNAAAVRSCEGCRDGAGFDLPFGMAFQPIVDLAHGKVFAYEALVRGPAGEPALTVLEQVTEENRYAFDQACRVKAIEGALAAGLLNSDARLSINFLPNAVYSPLACIQLTLKTAARVGLPAERLIFEFTENEQMAAPDHVEAIIDTYRRIGFGIAIDDFGAGQSGLDLFARFTPDMVKLDMDLVRDVDRCPRRQAIVRAMVGLCAELDTMLIAEGVETAAERDALHELRVSYQQGYLFARPAFAALPEVQF
jgi:EAL domain-containing protein (putative c-di-GMP-specific phosphodiesterase class I)